MHDVLQDYDETDDGVVEKVAGLHVAYIETAK